MPEIKILPSLFAANFADLPVAMEQMNKAGISGIHYDIMDNHFVPNMSFGIQMTEQVMNVASGMIADIHLMIDLNTPWKPFLDLKPEVLTIHAEAGGDTKEILRTIRNQGVKAGLSIKPNTPVEAVKPFLGEFDLLLVMSVEPGFSFQSFIPNSVERVQEARELVGDHVIIEADGGINRNNMKILKEAGLDWFVMGGGFFKDKDRDNLEITLKNL